jgi:hypothetical protein
MEKDKKYVAEGIGPNTTTYFGFYEAKELLSSWGRRIQEGSLVRHNELGTAIMGSGPWPETGSIALGFSNADHAVARPYIGLAVDGARLPEGVPCDGSNGWNRQYLRQFWRQRLNSQDSFSTSDMGWWCTQLLHKIHLNIDLTDEECQEFMNFPSCLSFPGAGKVGVGLGNITDRELPLIKCFTPIPCFNCKTANHLEDIKAALMEKFPNEGWGEEKLSLVGQMFLDSLMYAGGLSVPTIMQNMFAWWFSDNRPRDLDRVAVQDDASIADFMWETIRKNPPVAGVPCWTSDDGGKTFSHHIANVEQALGDDRVFPEPMKFKMGRPGLNAMDYSKSISWADFAIVNNDTCHPDSHCCPGKFLTMEMIMAFWQEFLTDQATQPWTTDTTGISVGYNLTTTFSLSR